MLEFRTLGTIDLRRGSGESIVSVLGHSKRLSLLAYLCASCPPGLHRRDTLIALLWPELDEAHARGALRHELYELRIVLGPGTLRGGGDESVGIDGQRLWCDATAFEAAVHGGRLQEAMELWRGDFLPGLHVNEGEFEHWLDGARDRLARGAVDAARRLSREAEATGGLAAALAWARRVTELAPWDETDQQRLIMLLDRSGDRAGALMAYDALTTRLREELEVEPSPETRALAEGIRQRGHVVALPTGDAPAARPQPPGESGTPARVAPTALQPPDAASRPHSTDARRGPQRRAWHLLRYGALAVPAAALLITAWMATRPSTRGRTVIESPQVENLTGDTSLELVRRRVADLLAEALVGIEFVDVIAPGQRDRVDVLLSASLYQRGDAVEVRTRLAHPGPGGQVVEMPAPVLVVRDDPDPALEEVIARVLAAIHAHYDPRFEGAGVPVNKLPLKAPPWEAYSEYVRGADLFGAKDYGSAAPHLLEAYRLGYAKAAVFGAIALAYGGQPAVADSFASTLLASESLGDYERSFASWFLADLHGRRRDAYQAAREYERAGGGTSPSAIAVAAMEAMKLNRPHEAVQKFNRVDVDHGWLRNYGPLWEGWSGAHHMRGKHWDELAVARAARMRFPASVETIRTEVRARSALRQFDQVTQLINEASTMPANGSSPADVAWVAAQELAAHGQPKEAAAARKMALQWLGRRPSANPGETLLHARLLLESGDADAAQRMLATLPARRGLDWLGLTGLVAAARGDTATAHAAVAQLEALRDPYLSGRHLLLSSGILATLGQPDLAMETLRGALAAGLPFGVELHAMPMLQPLARRSDFKHLLRLRG
jgi:DNA-binding SARP family transcriptional activator